MTEPEWDACADPTPMLEFLRGPASAVTRGLLGRQVVFTEYPSKRMSERKARLFACACCRRFWRLLDEEHCRRLMDFGRRAGSLQGLDFSEPSPDSCHKAIYLVERSADGPVSSEELTALSRDADALHFPATDYAACYDDGWGPFDTELMASGVAAYAVYQISRECGARPSTFGRLSEAFDSLPGVIWQTTQAAAYLRSTGFGGVAAGGDPQEREAQCALLREIVGNPFRPVALDPVYLSWNDGAIPKMAQAIYDDRTFDRLPLLADALEDAGCADEGILRHCREPATHVRGCWVLDAVLGKE